ncbi:MAG: hypothetical protein FIA92_10100 [Chloroflexi bacterium]|nr:hypothetical protein [Chloroflexota bacterium]
MRAALLGLCGVLAAWLVLSPWLLGYTSQVAWVADAGGGVLMLGLLVAGVAGGASAAGVRRGAAVAVAFVALVVALAAVGGLLDEPRSGLNEVVVGLLIAVLALVATQLSTPESIVAVDKDGRTLAEFTSIVPRGGALAMKGKLLGAMPATIYLTPAEFWKLLGLVDLRVILSLPGLAVRGWLAARRERETRPAGAGTTPELKPR